MKDKQLIHLDEEGRLGLEQFDKFLDITKVAYYSLEPKENGCLYLTFYDENKEQIKLFVC